MGKVRDRKRSGGLIWMSALVGCYCGILLAVSERFTSIRVREDNDNQLYLVDDSKKLNLHGFRIAVFGTEMFQEEYETRAEAARWLKTWIYGLAAFQGIAGGLFGAVVGSGLCGILSYLQIRHRNART